MSKDDFGSEAHESLLYSARHGELLVVKAMLEAKNEGKLTLDINCKGMILIDCLLAVSSLCQSNHLDKKQ